MQPASQQILVHAVSLLVRLLTMPTPLVSDVSAPSEGPVPSVSYLPGLVFA